jgi:prepilin-type processing-associated H-X9-DG protein
MKDVETRQVNRDSLFLLAQLRVEGHDEVYRVKVRNLSGGGMMAEGIAAVSRGQLVQIELRNIGWVDGSVAWKQDDRFGIAFMDEIDPKLARAPVGTGANPTLSTAHRVRPLESGVDLEKLRKI